MLTATPPLFRKNRGRPVRTPPSPPVALTLLSVEILFPFDGADGEVRLVFNTTAENPIGDIGAATPSKWSARSGGFGYEGLQLFSDTYNSVILHLVGTGENPGPDGIGYSNAPSDIGDALGRMLGAFSGFPLA